MNSDKPISSLNKTEPFNPEKPEEFGGEPLEGSGFEAESPDPDFEWRAAQ